MEAAHKSLEVESKKQVDQVPVSASWITNESKSSPMDGSSTSVTAPSPVTVPLPTAELSESERPDAAESRLAIRREILPPEPYSPTHEFVLVSDS